MGGLDAQLAGGHRGGDDRAELGELAGSAKARAWGEQAERHSPVLRTHDARGNRLDEVEYHPAYHQLMRVGVEHGLGGGAW